METVNQFVTVAIMRRQILIRVAKSRLFNSPDPGRLFDTLGC
jgi:hypothetical protein